MNSWEIIWCLCMWLWLLISWNTFGLFGNPLNTFSLTKRAVQNLTSTHVRSPIRDIIDNFELIDTRYNDFIWKLIVIRSSQQQNFCTTSNGWFFFSIYFLTINLSSNWAVNIEIDKASVVISTWSNIKRQITTVYYRFLWTVNIFWNLN